MRERYQCLIKGVGWSPVCGGKGTPQSRFSCSHRDTATLSHTRQNEDNHRPLHDQILSHNDTYYHTLTHPPPCTLTHTVPLALCLTCTASLILSRHYDRTHLSNKVTLVRIDEFCQKAGVVRHNFAQHSTMIADKLRKRTRVDSINARDAYVEKGETRKLRLTATQPPKPLGASIAFLTQTTIGSSSPQRHLFPLFLPLDT